MDKVHESTFKPEAILEVLGPLTVLAAPIYAPDDEAFPVLLATLPNGLAVAIEDREYFDYAESPVSIFRHLKTGDVIVCERAIRADTWGEMATWQKAWERRYYAGGVVYQLVNGKAVDLFEKLMAELDDEEPERDEDNPPSTVTVH